MATFAQIKSVMGKRFFAFLWFLLLSAAAVVAADGRFTLVIDAGHGGNDAGARGKISKEKNINLSVALAFGRYVERNCPDVKVVYTRKTDVFVPLHERANIANRAKADLFVSIHTNALPRGKVARGMETYTLGMHRAADNLDVAKRENSVILFESDYKQHYEGFDPNSSESYIMFEFLQDRNMAQSVELARLVQRRTCAETGRADKGVKQAGFLVLRETSMPSCLIELGFITTADEERYLNTSSGVDAMARGIYKAFVDYKKRYGRDITVPFAADKDSGVRLPGVVPDADKPKRETRRERRQREKAEREAREAAEKAREAEQEAAREATAKAAPEAVQTAEGIAAELASARMGGGTEAAAGAVKAESKANGGSAERPVGADGADGAGETESPVATSAPVFKVQLLASSRRLPADSPQFKGLQGVECYEDGGLFKFTYGSSADYNEISRLRKSVIDKFPEAFIVAFKDGRRTDVVAAIREFKQNRNNKK